MPDDDQTQDSGDSGSSNTQDLPEPNLTIHTYSVNPGLVETQVRPSPGSDDE